MVPNGWLNLLTSKNSSCIVVFLEIGFCNRSQVGLTQTVELGRDRLGNSEYIFSST